MGYNLLINGVYWGYNPLTNHVLSSWYIQVWGLILLSYVRIINTPLRIPIQQPGWLMESVFFRGDTLLTRWWQLKYVLMFIPIPGEMIQFDEHIFQMGWNHHLVMVKFLGCSVSKNPKKILGKSDGKKRLLQDWFYWCSLVSARQTHQFQVSQRTVMQWRW